MKKTKVNINEFLTKNKKLMLFGPIVLVTIILGCFLLFKGEEKSKMKANKSAVDMSLPSSSGKDTLPENKLDAFEQYDQYTEEKAQQDQKGNSMNAGLNTDMPNDNKKDQASTTVYQQPKNDVTQKLNVMIAKLNKEKKTQGQNQYGANVYKTATYENNGSGYARGGLTTKEKEDPMSEFQKESRENFDGFFKNKKTTTQQSTEGVTDAIIYAVVHGDQTIKTGDRVNLRLTKDGVINNQLFRANTQLYATATFSTNRVNLRITNINAQNIKLVALDAQDGNPGIYVEGESLAKETASEIENEQSRDINVSGIPVGRAIKKIFSKKKQESKVLLLNNYRLILKLDK